jgi:hypothetical protein
MGKFFSPKKLITSSYQLFRIKKLSLQFRTRPWIGSSDQYLIKHTIRWTHYDYIGDYRLAMTHGSTRTIVLLSDNTCHNHGGRRIF